MVILDEWGQGRLRRPAGPGGGVRAGMPKSSPSCLVDRVAATASGIGDARRRPFRLGGDASDRDASPLSDVVAEDAIGGISIEVVPSPVVWECEQVGVVRCAPQAVEIVHGCGDGGYSGITRQDHVAAVNHETEDHGAVVARVVAAGIVEEDLGGKGNRNHLRTTVGIVPRYR